MLDRAPATTDSGSFVGYLAAWQRDLGGDMIEPAAIDATLSDFRAGRIRWLLTDAHSPKASDVVAVVDAAAPDARGLRIEARWTGSAAAQALRGMARNGVPLGLSIDYVPRSWRPDGDGGRVLTDVHIVGGAIVTAPMNPAAMIISGKSGASVAPVVDVFADAQARQAKILAAAAWPPAELVDALGVDAAYGLLEGAARAKAAQTVQSDPERARSQARWKRDNDYSNALSAWMAAHR